MNIKTSVLTPSWNRGNYLKKVWEGLNQQTYRNFEWIVANDGSEDDTIKVVKKLAEKSNFPVTLINASCRIGKSRMDNEAVRAARGEFIIWCDSDDYLLPNALEVLIRTWESIPLNARNDYCGVSALCDTKTGVLGNIFYSSEDPIDLVWNELFLKLNSDLVIFTRSELVKAEPFLEVDFLIPESSVWSIIGTRKTRFLPVSLKRVSYGEVNCITKSGKMSYNRGNAYAMAIARENAAKLLSKTTQLIRVINYMRYCRHGEIGFKQAISLWNASLTEIFILLAVLPLSEILAVKDILQRKVRKTHREFLRARTRVRIETEMLNYRL